MKENIEQKRKPPIVKLFKNYAIKQDLQPSFDESFICEGIWTTNSVEEKEDGHRVYGFVCTVPFSTRVKIGDTRKMYEEVVIALCERIEIQRYTLLNSTPNDEVSDTTDDASSTDASNKEERKSIGYETPTGALISDHDYQFLSDNQKSQCKPWFPPVPDWKGIFEKMLDAGNQSNPQKVVYVPTDVKDELPTLNEDIMCATRSGYQGTFVFRTESNMSEVIYHYAITHWLKPTTVSELLKKEGQLFTVETESCGICGSKKVEIRGKHPKQPPRLVCPCCAQERLEQIQEISSPSYGQAYQVDKAVPIPLIPH